jgi:hypothetical protein
MDEALFKTELSALPNRHSADTATSTPDFLLAEYLWRQLQAYAEAMSANVKWHGNWPTSFTVSEK